MYSIPRNARGVDTDLNWGGGGGGGWLKSTCRFISDRIFRSSGGPSPENFEI